MNPFLESILEYASSPHSGLEILGDPWIQHIVPAGPTPAPERESLSLSKYREMLPPTRSTRPSGVLVLSCIPGNRKMVGARYIYSLNDLMKQMKIRNKCFL